MCNERFDMLIVDQGWWTFRCSTRAFERSRCVIRAYITGVTYSMGVFQKKKKRREGKARGDKGELSWENGGTDAARRHLVSRRENRLSLFLHPCILLAFSSVRFVNRENLYFLRE